MEYYTFSQGSTENDEERGSGKHHVKNTWVKERYESDEEDGSREEEVNKLILKEDDEEEMVTSSSTMLTSKVRYLNYGALKHDSPPAPAPAASGGGGGRVMPPPSNKYHRGHPKFYRCRG